MSAHHEALELVRKRCPGWAYAVLRQHNEDAENKPPPSPRPASAAATAGTVDALWKWGKEQLPLAVCLKDGTSMAAEDPASFRMALRVAYEVDRLPPAVRGKDGTTLVLSKQDITGLLHIVPPKGPEHPLVAMVGLHPTAIDAARSEPFSGPDGRYLTDHYLTPLGLTKAEVLLAHALPVAGEVSDEELLHWVGWAQKELGRHQPRVVIALGKQAKDHLGELAHFTLPHPASVRKSGDTAQLLRKLKQVKERLVALKEQVAKVHVAKADEEKRIVYGVVLDGYQFDSQGDWVPPSDIEATAHDYMEKSRVVNLQHESKADAVVVESWLWPYPSSEDYKKAMAGEAHSAYAAKFGTDVVHSGAWVMGTKILDDDTWAKIQDGSITAYSIGGTGMRAPTTAKSMPEVTFINA